MAITRSLTNGMKVTDWTQEVNEIGNMYGAVNEMNIFGAGVGTSQDSVVFEKNHVTHELVPQTSKYGGSPVKGKDRKTEVFALALPYFQTNDFITPQDIQGFRKVGTPDQVQDLASAIAIKMEDMRSNIDQTKEFMKITALQGVTVDPEYRVIADMFSEFGLNADNFDVAWDLANNAFQLTSAIRELRRRIARNLRTGGRMGSVTLLVTPEFFDALVNHPDVKDAYMFYAGNRGNDPLRDNLQSVYDFGVMDIFEFQGIRFMSYEPTFTLPSGVVVKGFGEEGRVIGSRRQESASMGIALVSGMEGSAYRAYYGSSNTLSGANQMGQPLFVYQWNDPKDKFVEMELETSPLYVCMKPQVAIRVYNAAALPA